MKEGDHGGCRSGRLVAPCTPLLLLHSATILVLPYKMTAMCHGVSNEWTWRVKSRSHLHAKKCTGANRAHGKSQSPVSGDSAGATGRR